ncbi:MAG: hypothetical protein JW727_01400 [Candidatus Aenigmarchaeota archaeon]|nr:hypothetical protein [Candidatus Aenigmarchaeota archaeon]
MVMITVVLIAFSYTWLQGTMEGSQQRTSEVISNTEKLNQKVAITTVYQDGGAIYFELKALTTNSYSVNMTGTSYYINGVPKGPEDWTGGISGGVSCMDPGLMLAPGAKCYGMLDEDCGIGDVFKVSIAWGAEDSKSISNCS